jgi:hypothetical protein
LASTVAKVSLVETATAADTRVASVMKEAASDGLPTAMTEVADERWPVKLDSGARYSVAGTDWMMRGEQLREAPPVDVVECIGGFVLDAIGVWAFQMRNVFGQLVGIKACIFDGCTEEFLVGVDFLAKHRANVDSTVTKCGTSSRTGWRSSPSVPRVVTARRWRVCDWRSRCSWSAAQ